MELRNENPCSPVQYNGRNNIFSVGKAIALGDNSFSLAKIYRFLRESANTNTISIIIKKVFPCDVAEKRRIANKFFEVWNIRGRHWS